MKLKDTIRGAANRVAENLEVFKKDIFEMQGVPAYRQFYTLFMFTWKFIYKGFYKDWHTVPAPTVNDRKAMRQLATMNAGKMACEQLARYVWGEYADITVNQKGFTRTDAKGKAIDAKTDPLCRYVCKVLADNNFHAKMGELFEQCAALGGAAIKCWAEIPKNEDGTDAGTAAVKLSYHMADQFVPTRWDSSGVKDGLFISREAKDGYYYSRVEWHRHNGRTYYVTNDLYRMKISETAEPQNILGWWYPLSALYPLLSPNTEFGELEESFFSYFRPFGANNKDDNSPLGVSIFANALDTLHSIDICFDSFQREFVLGKKRIIVPASAIRHVVDPQSGRPVRYFDANDETYEALSIDDMENLKIQDNSVSLRVDEHISALNALLSIFAVQIGFDPGSLTFDPKGGFKTATEVISQNSKTYNTVKNQQNIFEGAIKKTVEAIINLSVYYGIEFEGQSVESLVSGGYDVSVHFDDSILQDRQTNINEGVTLTGAGLLSKRKFLIDTLGYTPEEADAELAQIAAEQNIGGFEIDKMFPGGEDETIVGKESVISKAEAKKIIEGTL